jgi:hypothetical protein
LGSHDRESGEGRGIPAAGDVGSRNDSETTVVLPRFAANVALRRARREDNDATVILPPL